MVERSRAQHLGKYEILEELGRGGFATVYRARDRTLEREVALKVLHPQLLTDPSFVERFQREARTLAGLRHPHIVTIYEVGEVGGQLFIAMELARGPSLAQALGDRERFSWQDTLEMLKPVCDALDYAHGQGVTHRDLKPANILLDEERGPLLTDFGFARLMASHSASLSLSGGVVGTPSYIAPEVWEADAVGPPVDIYAMGCIAFEMLTGQALFPGNTPMQVMRAHVKGPQFPTEWPEGVPDGITNVLRKALAQNPDDRWPSELAFSQALSEGTWDQLGPALKRYPESAKGAEGPLPEPVPLAPPGTGASAFHPTASPYPSTAESPSRAATPGSAQAAQPRAATTAPRKIAGLPLLPFVLGVAAVAFVCIVALAVVLTQLATTGQLAQRAQQESINATQPAVAVALSTQEADTPTPPPTLTDYPTYTPPPSPAERVVVVTPTPPPAADTPPTPPQATDTPPPPPTYTPLPTYTLQPTHTPLPSPTDTPAPVVPAASDETPTREAEVVPISGKLAVPVDNGFGSYDVIVYQLPDAEVVAKISNARQPNFRSDGVLAVNGEGRGADNVWQYTADGAAVGEVSASPGDNHPFWKADASGIVYDNPEMVCAKTFCPEWHVYVQAGANKPETLTVADKFILDGDVFRDQPMYPVWASDDYILFRACDIWRGGGGAETCGIWRTPSWATRGGTGFSVPANLTSNDDIPTDTKGDRLVHMSARDGNWEVYVMAIAGGPATNVSKDSADDGLGTISPDGKWVAFVSNRGGNWGVWVAPTNGGSATRVPIDVLAWGSGSRDWTNERISWGP